MRARSSSGRPLAAAAAARVWVSRPFWRAIAWRVTSGKGERLQHRHRGRDPVRAGHRGGAADGPVGADDAGQGGEQLGGVERDLALRGA